MITRHSNIVDLVLSLTRSEKKQFRKLNDGEPDFIILFNYISKQKNYDSAKFRDFLIRKKKNEEVDKFTSGYLSVIKAYLKDKIYQALRIFHASKASKFNLANQALIVDVLMEKGLYDLARRELERIKKIHYDLEFPPNQLLFLRREGLINLYEGNLSYGIEEIEELYKEQLHALDNSRLEIQYIYAASMIKYFQFNGNQDEEGLKRLKALDFIQSKPPVDSFAIRYLYHWVNAQLARLSGEKKKAIHHFNESLNVWLESPKLIKAYPKIYLLVCFSYLKMINEMGLPNLILQTHDFDYLFDQIDKDKLIVKDQQRFKLLFFLGKFSELINLRHFQEILKHESEIHDLLILAKEISLSGFMSLSFQWTYACFKTGKYEAALDWTTRCLDDADVDFFKNKEFYSRLKLLAILIHYEMGHIKFLQYEIKKVKMDFTKKGYLFAYIDSFLQMMQQLIGKRYADKQYLVLKNFQTKFQEFTQSENFLISFYSQHLLEWINEKLGKQKPEDFIDIK